MLGMVATTLTALRLACTLSNNHSNLKPGTPLNSPTLNKGMGPSHLLRKVVLKVR